ncbi:hypothetical protein F4803DRAFT_533686 [Xylaria telfairii]|nr:hypothetical protein F4803DRAFT_533686 [Xylaria telfairii]
MVTDMREFGFYFLAMTPMVLVGDGSVWRMSLFHAAVSLLTLTVGTSDSCLIFLLAVYCTIPLRHAGLSHDMRIYLAHIEELKLKYSLGRHASTCST